MTADIVWLIFVVCVIVIGYAGHYLSRYGNSIAENLGWSHAWSGMILLATVTSLPELVTGISAVTLADTPNVALGDALGSCVFNLLILALLDLLHPRLSVYSVASQGHILAAGWGVILLSFVGLNIFLAHANIGFQWRHIGVYSPVIILMYVLAARLMFRYESVQMAKFVKTQTEKIPTMPLHRAITGYVISALFVVAAGLALPFIGKAMAEAMGWHTTFTGSLFIAFATSVPELAVTISALRIGALDMAIANVLGSNLFDIFIIALDDILYVDGPLLAKVSQLHVVTAMFAVLMSGVAIVGLMYRAKTKLFKAVGWASMVLAVLYLMNGYIVYLHNE